ncbi:MAG: tetratricopeptide repeat protein [Bacteroidota bacterium]|nr:tetratricopeptide repeat protein [Bacteroidota bacterium]
MKKTAILLLAVLPAFAGFSQQAKLVNSIKYYKDFSESKDKESISRAKENVDLASEHPDTKDKAKTQNIKGHIYVAIFENNLRTQIEKDPSITDPKKKEAVGYQNTGTAELEIAYQAYMKAKSLDDKSIYTAEITDGINRISVFYNNKASYDYNNKKYAESMASFEKAYEIGGSKDTNLLYNMALTAERSENYEKAKQFYAKMIEGKQGKGNTYASLVNVYLMSKDTAGGMDYLKKGRAAYPNDINMLITETNFFLKSNRSEEAMKNLTLAIQAKPADANLYLVRGNMYDNMANPKDNAGKDLEKPKDYEEKLKLAEADYKKAIELKPDYFDALYNLGVLYNNHGVAIAKVADKITDNAKYAAENEKASAEFSKAMPVLEKAHQINPKDKGAMIALKQIYARLQMMDKAKEMGEKIKGN